MTDEEQLALNAALADTLAKYLQMHPAVSPSAASATLVDIAVLVAKQHDRSLKDIVKRVHVAWEYYAGPRSDSMPPTEN